MGLYFLQLGLISAVIYRLLKLYCSVHVKAVSQRMWQLFTIINEARRNTERVGKIMSFPSCKCDSYRCVSTKDCLFSYPLIHFLMCLNIRAEASNFGKVNGGKINWSGINCHSTLMMLIFDTLIKYKANNGLNSSRTLTNRNWSKSLCYLYFFIFFPTFFKVSTSCSILLQLFRTTPWLFFFNLMRKNSVVHEKKS